MTTQFRNTTSPGPSPDKEQGPFFTVEDARGVIRIDGRDALDLINRLGTNRIDHLRPGEVRETLLTTEKGRIIDAILVHVRESDVQLLTSAGKQSEALAWLEKFTIMEECEYTDDSALYAQCSVYNIRNTPAGLILPEPCRVQLAVLDGIETTILRHDSVTGSGLRLICKRDQLASIRDYLQHQGIPLFGRQAFDLWRVRTLTPAVGYELSERTNPLESGATRSVDFHKGCYIGQEVIARLDSYDKVQRTLCRLSWDDAPSLVAPGSELLSEGVNAGFVTTHVPLEGDAGYVGIACIRTSMATEGRMLQYHEGEANYTVIVGSTVVSSD